ncbi:hypothetical protein E4T63_19760 [Pseudomonas fluorescens]|uniref:Uncharacterized protein n=1 Tax=Pseudomonas fluorescens TaxID=294 RepID=A0AAP8Z0Q6_PSEFL|nr:hypothetical protein E4T63_19760 [Pseudomonas fluorescens]
MQIWGLVWRCLLTLTAPSRAGSLLQGLRSTPINVGASLLAMASFQTPQPINAGACGTSAEPFSPYPAARRCPFQ